MATENTSLHVQACMKEGKAAGWSGDALARLVVAPESATMAGFRAQLAEANGIKSLVEIVGPSMRALGYDPDTAADYFVAQGHSYERVRRDTATTMAEHDEDSVVDTTPRAMAGRTKAGVDVYASRAKEIDQFNGAKNG